MLRYFKLVREERLELSRVSPLDPKSSASANSATLARRDIFRFLSCHVKV
jgi:hypothetical protein